MKVLFIISAFEKPSGAENVLLDYLKTEKRIDPAFLIVGSHKETANLFMDAFDKKNVFFVESASGIMSKLSRFILYRLFRLVLCIHIQRDKVYRKLNSERKYDVVYYNNSFESMTFYPLFPRAKKIIHIHDMIDMFRPAQKECLVSACRKAQIIIAASDSCGKMISKNGVDQSKIMIARNSIELPSLPYQKKDTDTITIGFVGSAIQRKGFDLYIKILNAVNALMKERQSSRKIKALIITNTDKTSGYLRENIEKISKDIEISENYCLPRQRVMELYHDMDLLLVPSRFDPLPTVVLESYLVGTPVIGTAKDGMLEMQIDTRMMFELEDVKNAALAVLGWINLSEVQQAEIILKTQNHIQTEFTAQKKRDCVYSALQRIVEME